VLLGFILSTGTFSIQVLCTLRKGFRQVAQIAFARNWFPANGNIGYWNATLIRLYAFGISGTSCYCSSSGGFCNPVVLMGSDADLPTGPYQHHVLPQSNTNRPRISNPVLKENSCVVSGLQRWVNRKSTAKPTENRSENRIRLMEINRMAGIKGDRAHRANPERLHVTAAFLACENLLTDFLLSRRHKSDQHRPCACWLR